MTVIFIGCKDNDWGKCNNSTDAMPLQFKVLLLTAPSLEITFQQLKNGNLIK